MRDFLIIILNKMANETWPQGPSKKIQSIMDWLSDAQKDEMLILLQQDKEIREKKKSMLIKNEVLQKFYHEHYTQKM